MICNGKRDIYNSREGTIGKVRGCEGCGENEMEIEWGRGGDCGESK